MFGFGSSWKDAAEDSLRELRGDGFVSPIQRLIDAAPEPEAFHREYPSAVEDAELDKWWRGECSRSARSVFSLRARAIPPNPDLSSLFPGESGLNSQTMLLLAGAMALFMMKRQK